MVSRRYINSFTDAYHPGFSVDEELHYSSPEIRNYFSGLSLHTIHIGFGRLRVVNITGLFRQLDLILMFLRPFVSRVRDSALSHEH